jgi:hypothetical protein
MVWMGSSTEILVCHEDQRQCLVAAKDVGGVQTYTLPTKGTHHSTIQPAPDPVKLDLNLSLLGGEQMSTPISKFSSDLYSDAVDQDPSVKRFSVTTNLREDQRGIQG